MFEILMYLFENYMEGSVAFNVDPHTITNELELAGFQRQDIHLALDWLDGLNRFQELVITDAPDISARSIRHYTAHEASRLNVEGRGFLMYLEQLSVLDPLTREIVIDRLMALDDRFLHIGAIKWVVLIALFNQPDKKAALSLLQEMVLTDAFDVLH